MANFTLQLLHHADFEGNTNAIDDAPKLAALFDHFDNTYVGNTLKLSGGDNWIPSPWYNSQSSTDAMNAALQNVYETHFGLEQGTLSGLEASPGTLDQAILNVMGIQASALGNHEFDAGPDDVARIIEFAVSSESNSPYATTDITNIGSLFPYLSTNLVFSDNEDLNDSFTSALQNVTEYGVTTENLASAEGIAAQLPENGADMIAPFATVEVGGETIGLVGATTQRLAAISSPDSVTVEGASDDDMLLLASQVQTSVDTLTDQGVNKVILISHLQDYTNEASLATMLSDVDVILSAGSDAIFADSTDLLKEGHAANENSYPLVHTDKDGNPILQINTDGQYNYLGRLVVEFNEEGIVQTDSIDPTESGAYATTDEIINSLYSGNDPYQEGTIAGLVKELSDAVNTIIGEKLENVAGYTDVFLDGQRSTVRNQESNLGNLTADANLQAAKEFIAANNTSLNDPSAPVVSLKNGGGIRAEIGLAFGVSGPEAPVGGEVNQLDIETTLAFNNGLVLYSTSVSGLKDLLEHGIDNAGTTSGRFPQVSGLSFEYESNNESGNKIVSLSLTDENGNVTDKLVENGNLLVSADKAINIVSLNFLVENDGDGYPFAANQIGELTYLYDQNAGATFTSEGREQKAFFDYMQANFGSEDTAYSTAETAIDSDDRIQLAETIFENTAGADTFEGDAGLDTVNYMGSSVDYAVVKSESGFTVTQSQISDVLSGIERINFDNASVALDINGAESAGAAYRLYELFDRTPDQAGLGYWIDQFDNGASLQEIAQSFIESNEFSNLYGSNLTDEAFVNTLYENILNRSADQSGLDYWVNDLANGASRAAVLTGFTESSENQANTLTEIENGFQFQMWIG